MSSYYFITNPFTNKKYNILSSEGKNIINNYLYLVGGSTLKMEDVKNKSFDEISELWKNPSTKQNVIDIFNSLNEEQVIELIEKNGHFLKFMDEEKKNEEILLEIAIQNTEGTALQWASPELKKNALIVNQSLIYDPLNVQWADKDKYLNNSEFMQKLMDRNYQSLQFATKRIKDLLQYNPSLEYDEYLEEKSHQERLPDSEIDYESDYESDYEDFSY